MAAHREKEKKRVDSRSAEVRKDLFKKLEPLSEKWVAHLSESLLAVVPCSYCVVRVEEKDGKTIINTSAPKYDDAGQCLKCHGRKVVPDQDQRNWAADEIGNRLAPAPKTIEEPEEDTQALTDFAKSLEGKSDDEIKRMMEQIGLADVQNSSGSKGVDTKGIL